MILRSIKQSVNNLRMLNVALVDIAEGIDMIWGISLQDPYYQRTGFKLGES